MLQSNKPRPSANQVNGSTRKPATQADENSTIQEGLKEMFIGYLLYCELTGWALTDKVHTAYVNLLDEPILAEIEIIPEPPTPAHVPVKQPKTPEPRYYTISAYANKCGINGFNQNLAARLSYQARLECKKSGKDYKSMPVGTNSYPVDVLQRVFLNPIF